MKPASRENALRILRNLAARHESKYAFGGRLKTIHRPRPITLPKLKFLENEPGKL